MNKNVLSHVSRYNSSIIHLYYLVIKCAIFFEKTILYLILSVSAWLHTCADKKIKGIDKVSLFFIIFNTILHRYYNNIIEKTTGKLSK